MSWEQASIAINPIHMSLWRRIQTAWKLLRNKTEFRVTVCFTSPEGNVTVDSVHGRWEDK